MSTDIHTHKNTQVHHTCGPAFYPPPFFWWMLDPHWRDVTTSLRHIVGNDDQMATSSCEVAYHFPLRPFFQGAPRHTHLSDETTDDGKWVDGCQNGRRLLFTNLIILFSSRWARWVITPPAYKSHGWCTSHTIAGRIAALCEGARHVAVGHQLEETQIIGVQTMLVYAIILCLKIFSSHHLIKSRHSGLRLSLGSNSPTIWYIVLTHVIQLK